MKKLTDLIKESESNKPFKYQSTVIVEGTVYAESEGSAGELVDKEMDEIPGMISYELINISEEQPSEGFTYSHPDLEVNESEEPKTAAKIVWNDFYKKYQALIDGSLYEEFDTPEEGAEYLANGGYNDVTTPEDLATETKIDTNENINDDSIKVLNTVKKYINDNILDNKFVNIDNAAKLEMLTALKNYIYELESQLRS